MRIFFAPVSNLQQLAIVVLWISSIFVMDVGRDLSWSLGGVSANQVLGDERDAFRRADHVVERRVHEVEGPL